MPGDGLRSRSDRSVRPTGGRNGPGTAGISQHSVKLPPQGQASGEIGPRALGNGGFPGFKVRIRRGRGGQSQVVCLYLNYYLSLSLLLSASEWRHFAGTKMTSPLEQADDGGGLTISSMVKEFQGLKDKFKREDADSRELSVYIYFELLSPYSFSLLRP